MRDQHRRRWSLAEKAALVRQGRSPSKRHAVVLGWLPDQVRLGSNRDGALTKDCCDREILVYRAWESKGLPGEPVREMLIEEVEKRFGNVEGIPEARALECLSDNGGAYIAAETRQIARQLVLRPINTPVCSPQSNGMAESFVDTFTCDYVGRMDLTDARTVMAEMAAAFEHFNQVHPHSALKIRSPREFMQHCAAPQRSVQVGQMRHRE